MSGMGAPTIELQEVVRRLVNSLQPEQIYLFGSYARGTQTQGQSDIDLWVIVPESDLPRHQAEKSIKAYLTWRDETFEKTHSLVALVSKCLTYDSTFKELRQAATLLTPMQ